MEMSRESVPRFPARTWVPRVRGFRAHLASRFIRRSIFNFGERLNVPRDRCYSRSVPTEKREIEIFYNNSALPIESRFLANLKLAGMRSARISQDS